MPLQPADQEALWECPHLTGEDMGSMKPCMRPLQSSFTLPAAWCGHKGPRGQVGRGREKRATATEGGGWGRIETPPTPGHAPTASANRTAKQAAVCIETPPTTGHAPHPRPIGPQSTAAVCSEAPPRPRPRLTLSLGQSDRETEWSRSVRLGFAGGSAGKQSACNAGDPAATPGSGRSPGERERLFLPGGFHRPWG